MGIPFVGPFPMHMNKIISIEFKATALQCSR